jgi:hypothetical protein
MPELSHTATNARKRRDTARMIFGGVFAVFFLFMMAVTLVPLGFAIYSLVDVSRTPDAAFGPPWDNGKSAWTLGMALAIVIPFGTIVGPVLWFTQGRNAVRAGRQVPRPFWSPRPAQPPYPYPYPPQPPAPPQP